MCVIVIFVVVNLGEDVVYFVFVCGLVVCVGVLFLLLVVVEVVCCDY